MLTATWHHSVVTRGPSNSVCQMCSGRWRLDQSDGDTWHWRVSVRGTVAVSPRTQERGIEILSSNEEHKSGYLRNMQILRELIKIQDEKRIAIEKEAAELEAKRKSQEFGMEGDPVDSTGAGASSTGNGEATLAGEEKNSSNTG
ncbi:hypothetical protein Tco_1220167 [Tanacetum coccineum]